MDNKLSCEIVRDLLPSYADGLTGSVTTKAIEEHLSGCADCAAAYRRMKEPAPAADNSDVDYLRTLRRRTRTRSAVIGIVLMLLGVSLIMFRVFYVGTAADASDAMYSVNVTDGVVTISGTLTSSALAVSRVTFTESAGTVTARLHTVPSAFWNSGDFTAKYKARGPVGQVRSGELVIWYEGASINAETARLYAASNLFAGDMPANSELADTLGVSGHFGAFTNELQTDTEPYGWSLILETPIADTDVAAAREMMSADAYVLLGLVRNLGYVTWVYDTDAGSAEYTVTESDATAFAGWDIKKCDSSPVLLQNLLQRLSWSVIGADELLQETGEFRLEVNCLCDDVYGLSVSYYLNGELIGTRCAENADGSAISKGDTLVLEFIPEDFPAGTRAADLSAFSFDLSVMSAGGGVTPVSLGNELFAKYAWTYYFTLTGSPDAGFVLNAG